MAMLAKLAVLAGMALPLYAQTADEQIAAHAKAALAAERQNDFPAAVRNYEYLARAFPHNAEVLSNLGVAFYLNQELNRAIDVFAQAMRLDPNLLTPHLFSGLALYRLTNPDAAVPELEKAVHMQPSDVVAHTWLGYAYVAQSRYDAAVNEFQAACHLAPDNVDAWYALGQSYLQIGRDATLKLLTIAPDGGRAWQLAGEQFQLRGDREKALEDFKEASKRRPDLPELRALVAEMGGTVTSTPDTEHNPSGQEDDLYRQAHAAEQNARRAFERVVQLAPDSYRAHQIVADSLVAEQRYDEATQEYGTVLKLKADLPGIHEAMGNSFVQRGKLAEALKEFQAEIQIQPRSATAHMNAGRVLLMMGDDDGAGKMLSDALSMDRPPLESYFLLGKLYLRRNDYRAAITALTHYLSTEKDASSAYYLLARAYRAVGEKEQMNRALDLYKKTSQDAKERNRAQKDLEPSDDKAIANDQSVDLMHTATH
ncbi:MAG: tetratricopeptide repeat protein [Acidobacteriaceae bacterium]